MVQHVELFQLALGLEWPWKVVGYDFSAAEKQLTLSIDFEPGGTFSCPTCERAGCKAYDTRDKSWRHLNFFQHEAYLRARVPRVQCAEHGIKQVEVPWARSGSGFTLLFEALVLAMAKEMPVKAVADLVDENDTRIWRILQHYVDTARAAEDFSGVRHLGLDETASKRGHNYISLFVDLERSKVLFGTEGRNAATVAEFRLDLERHGGVGEQIEEICIDMSPAFIQGVRKNFPLASMTFDKFHVMKIVGTAVDEVRRAEQRQRPELARTRYVWLKNPGNWTKRQREIFEELHPKRLNLKTVRAYQIKLDLQEFWTLPTGLGEAYLKRWYFRATHSQLEPIVEAARMVKRHWAGILRWSVSQISNGVLEAINSLVQAARARARGYRTTRNFITMAYLIAGKLQLGAHTK
jgi:transposase